MGPLQFKAGTGQLGCDFCGSTFTVAEVEAMYAEKDAKAAENMEAANQSGGDGWDTSGLSDDWGADAANMRSYLCPAIFAIGKSLMPRVKEGTVTKIRGHQKITALICQRKAERAKKLLNSHICVKGIEQLLAEYRMHHSLQSWEV
jgi:hypothetical protein